MEDENEDSRDKTKKAIYFYCTLAFLIVVALLVLNCWFFFYEEDRGTFGDMFGGANALFSGVAFVGIVAAIILQSSELKLQQKEMIDTRKVLITQREQLEAQHKQMEIQTETIRKQQFENTFFELLKFYNHTVDSIVFEDQYGLYFYEEPPPKVYFGKDAIKSLYIKFTRELGPVSEGAGLNETIELYESYGAIGQHTPMFSYFRVTYNIIKFIDRSVLSDADKDYYAGLLRAQFSNYELRYLALNCISQYGNQKLLPLMKKYNMFKHLPLDSIITNQVYLLIAKEEDNSRVLENAAAE